MTLRALLRNWWVLATLVMAWALYLQAIHKKNQLASHLEQKKAALAIECHRLELENEELKLRMQSQNDPEWLELVLKEKLGVVPEGQVKVVFK